MKNHRIQTLSLFYFFTGGQACTSVLDFPQALTVLPGSFQEFLPVIKPLTQSWTSPTGQNVSYNVIVPSLPGFLFSSPPPQNWTIVDTARLFNTLMTDVLGYSKYALHATDWVLIFLILVM
jgi:hypothetical protein